MLENPLSGSRLRQQLDDCKDDVFTAVHQALRNAGLENVYVRTIELFARPAGPQCPAGTEPTLEVFELPDGSIVYQVVCK